MNGVSEMQTGGRKGCSTIDNMMILLSIIEINQFLGQDIEKCFDNIWLDDAIKDLWQNGTNGCDAIIIKKMDTHAIATVRTPVGDTKDITLKNTVQQGGVYGPTYAALHWTN